MKKWQIKTKKDWSITFIFVFLILLVLSKYKSYSVQQFLVRFYPDKMNYTCRPEWCESFLIVTVGMTIFASAVLILKKKSVKIWGSVIAFGILLSVGAIAAFQYHCKLIVEMPEKSQPLNISLAFHDYESSLLLEGDDARGLSLSKLVYELEPLPEEEQKALKKVEREYETKIWVRYPEKYGQSYWMLCYVNGDDIYMQKEQGVPAVFYRDNGLLEELKKLEKDSE